MSGGEVFPVPVWGMCGRCRGREAQRRADLRRRTCQDCGTVFQTPAPARSFGDGMCLACDERLERGRRVALSLVERSCRRCLGQLFPLTVWAAMSEREKAVADWHCATCEREIEQERVQAQRRADRARWTTSGRPSRGRGKSSRIRTPTRSWTRLSGQTRLTSEICLCERTETITRSSASSQIKITA